ncbi:hypothetical protein IAD21_01417 [Abditibacteriota bacterium]|nr:hypothetical protein IAD21_01417 [Abditibacteriota bacterium]
MPSTPPLRSPSGAIKYWPRGARFIGICIVLATFGVLFLALGQKEQQSAETPELALQLGHSGPVNGLAISPDGKTLVSAGGDRTLRAWNLQTSELRRVVTRNKANFLAVAFSPNGQWLAAVAGGDFSGQELLLWDAHTGQLSRVLQTGGRYFSDRSRISLVFSPDNRTIGIAQAGSSIDLWDIGSGKKTQFVVARKGSVGDIAFSPNGKQFATAGEDGTARIWDTKTGQLKRTFKGDVKSLFAVAFSPDGKTLAGAEVVKAGEMMVFTFIHVWNVATGKNMAQLGQGGIVVHLSFTPDSKTLISGGGMLGSGEIQFWNVATGKSRRTITGRTDTIFPFILSSDGQTLVTAALTPKGKEKSLVALDYFGGDIQIWNASNGQLRHTILGFCRPVDQVAFTSDGKSIVEVGREWRSDGSYFRNDSSSRAMRRNVDVWDAETGKLRFERSGRHPFALSLDN